MVKISEALRAIKAAGFELEFHDDLATRGDEVPWYYPLAGEFKYARTLYDLLTVLRFVLSDLFLVMLELISVTQDN